MRLKVTIKTGENGDLIQPELAITNAETGEPLEHVRSIRFGVDCESQPLLILETYAFDAEIEASPTVIGRGPTPEQRDAGFRDITAITEVHCRRFEKLSTEPNPSTKADS